MWGLSLTALFQSRSGILPILVLMTRTPCEAGELDTTGIVHSSSNAIFHTSLAIRVRSWSFTLKDLRYLFISSRMRAVWFFPLGAALEYQAPYSGPMGLVGLSGKTNGKCP